MDSLCGFDGHVLDVLAREGFQSPRMELWGLQGVRMPLIDIEVVGTHRADDEHAVVAMLADLFQELQELGGSGACGRC